ncbi:hypothetical protein TNCV_2857941 [Trichonephila clavipes]|nr:hypothetical protein TNCV_2857941 [Trichonephila clavipes]
MVACLRSKRDEPLTYLPAWDGRRIEASTINSKTQLGTLRVLATQNAIPAIPHSTVSHIFGSKRKRTIFALFRISVTECHSKMDRIPYHLGCDAILIGIGRELCASPDHDNKEV